MSKKKTRPTTLVVSGSGTGGHITPVIAVADALKAKRKIKDLKIIFIGQSGDKMAGLVNGQNAIDQKLTIMSGKWRRYHGQGLKHLIDLPTILRNIRDVLFVFIGLIEALIWLGRIKPAAVFIKGGGIGVPVGLAAAFYGIPIVTHDSDAQPGLANRIVSKWVDTHTVAMPPEFYSYPEEDTVQVGIPISKNFAKAAKVGKAKKREACGLDKDKETILIFGGSLGAKRMNYLVSRVIDELLERGQVVHIVGELGYKTMKNIDRENYRILPFVKDKMHDYMAAADLIITRGGATALAEIATVGRPMIIIPNDLLTGGHQTTNAKILMEKGAAIMLSEDDIEKDSSVLSQAVSEVIDGKVDVKKMVKAQSKMVQSNPTEKIADILIKTINRGLNQKGRDV